MNLIINYSVRYHYSRVIKTAREEPDMAHLNMTYSDTSGILTLSGSLSGPHAVELREHLLHGLDRAGRIIVNCEQVTSIDTACLKLLCTAYRVSRMLKKDFVFAGNRIALFRQAAGSAETAHCAGSDRGCGQGCLWVDSDTGQYRLNDSLETTRESDSAAA